MASPSRPQKLSQFLCAKKASKTSAIGPFCDPPELPREVGHQRRSGLVLLTQSLAVHDPKQRDGALRASHLRRSPPSYFSGHRQNFIGDRLSRRDEGEAIPDEGQFDRQAKTGPFSADNGLPKAATLVGRSGPVLSS
jgi:hypothetical protein